MTDLAFFSHVELGHRGMRNCRNVSSTIRLTWILTDVLVCQIFWFTWRLTEVAVKMLKKNACAAHR